MKHTLTNILRATSQVMNISEEDIKSRIRKGDIVIARQLFCYIAYENYHTYQKIGDFLNRDHVSVLYSYKKIKNELEYYPDLKDYIQDIKFILSGIDEKWKKYHTIYNNINTSHTL